MRDDFDLSEKNPFILKVFYNAYIFFIMRDPNLMTVYKYALETKTVT